MKRTTTLTLAAAVLGALTACQPTTTTSGSSDGASTVTIHASSATTAVAPPASPSPTPKPKTSTASTCDPGPDVLVWTRVPGLPDTAQRIGSKYMADCTSSFAFIQRSSPTGDGYCTEAAWASDNPGYDENAEPAKRLKHVQVMVGPAC